MRKILCIFFCLLAPIYTQATTSEAELLKEQLSELKIIEKGFNNILLQKYDAAVDCFDEALALMSLEGYFSEAKYTLVAIGQLIVYAIVNDKDVVELFYEEYAASLPEFDEYLLLDNHVTSKCIAMEIRKDIEQILLSVEQDYHDPSIIRFDYGISRVRTWIIRKLRPLMKEFYAS